MALNCIVNLKQPLAKFILSQLMQLIMSARLATCGAICHMQAESLSMPAVINYCSTAVLTCFVQVSVHISCRQHLVVISHLVVMQMPQANVSASVSLSNTSRASVYPAQLLFTPEAWSVPQQVNIACWHCIF